MLTQKQLDLLVFIDNYINTTAKSPSFEEMKNGLGLKSKSGIHKLVNALVERGFLKQLPNRARALEVLKMPENIPSDTLSHSKPISASSTEEMVEIPLHGKIAAGTAIEAIRNEIDTISIPPNMMGSKSCYALTVEGDSMVNAGIMDGDVVIIEECDRANNGDIVVALVDEEEVTLKRLRREIGSIVLMPENDSYEPIRLEPHRVQVQGKLKTLFRYY